MELNGMKLPLSIALGVVAFAVGYGSLQAQVSEVKRTVEKRDALVTDMAVTKKGVEDNKETAKEIKQELKALKEKIDNDTKEILKAIREE